MLNPDMLKTCKIRSKPGYYYIDPQAAEYLLTGNVGNRNISPRHVDLLARAMLNDEWRDFGAPILISDAGIILDGQHRLMAIIASGTTQMMHIRWGVTADIQRVVDTGNPRTAGQQAHMEGWKHGNVIAAAIRVLVPLREDFGPYLAGPRHRKLSTAEILGFADSHRTRMEYAARTAVSIRSTIPINPAAVAAAAFQLDELASMVDSAILSVDVDRFFAALREGVNLPVGHPVLLLRSTLIRLRASEVKRSTEDHLYYLARAWNAGILGEKISKMQRPDSYTPAHFVFKGGTL